MVRDAPGDLERKTGTASLSRRTPHRAPDRVADPDTVVEASAVRRDLRYAGTNAAATQTFTARLVVPPRVASQSDISGAEPALSKSAKC
jgi:hypothetical protein